MKVLLVAGEAAGLQSLRALTRSSHHLVGILTAPSHSGFKGASVAAQADKMGIPVWPANLVRDPLFAAQVREAGVDILLNVHSLYLIHPDVLTAPAVGAFNLHPGPLPRYAGLNAPLWAIYRGEPSHGVTLHWMTPMVDAGPIAYQRLFPVDPTETGLSLSLKCVEAGVGLVGELLKAAEEGPGRIPRLEQDPSRREYLRASIPEEGRLHWDRPAAELLRFVRACDFRPLVSPWGHPKADLGGRPIEVLSAHRTARSSTAPPGIVGRTLGSAVEVACADEWVAVEDVLADGQACKAPEALGRASRG